MAIFALSFENLYSPAMSQVIQNKSIRKIFRLLLAGMLLLSFSTVKANEEGGEKFDAGKMIVEHISDAHDWHLWGEHDHAVSVPLPIILKSEKGLHFFMSSAFHHDIEGKHVVENNGERFVMLHNHIYYAADSATAEGGYVTVNEKGEATNAAPLDFSITKNVVMLLIVIAFVLYITLSAARHYKKNGAVAPKGAASFVEPIVIFVRDEIAHKSIGPKYKKFVPYLLTLFFFIWTGNILGLLPGAANLTGNIAVTFTLAMITFVIVNVNGNKDYWKHVFATPGVPAMLLPIMVLVEFIGLFTKPFALMVRLFVAITAGHIVILSFIALVFIFESYSIGVLSTIMVTFINVIELLVATIQAYVFTLFSAMYIGSAVAEHEHDDHH